MREILFKAKRFYNNEWVYGNLVIDNSGNPHIIESDFFYEDGHHIVYDDDTDKPMAFIPETVSQFTGLTDCNGNRIWENDIVKYTFDSPEDPTATENGLKIHVGRIFWSEWRASFAVTAGKGGSTSLNNDVARYVRGRSVYEYVRGANTVEVIGNIFDNPELLQRG